MSGLDTIKVQLSHDKASDEDSVAANIVERGEEILLQVDSQLVPALLDKVHLYNEAYWSCHLLCDKIAFVFSLCLIVSLAVHHYHQKFAAEHQSPLTAYGDWNFFSATLTSVDYVR